MENAMNPFHAAIGRRPEFRQAFYDLEKDGEVRGIGWILQYLAEEQAIFEWKHRGPAVG